jgi:hypothetical protein
MKILAVLIILILNISCPVAADSTSPSRCAKTLLTQAAECIKAKQTSADIALYIQVRDHPYSTLDMVLQVSRELKSHHLKEESVLGFMIAMSFSNISETQLLYVGENLIEVGNYELAKLALQKVLNHPNPLAEATRNYIAQLCASIPKENQ